MLLRTIVLNHHSLSQPWEVNRGAFYVAKASVKLVIFLPVHAGFATPGCIPVLTWWLGGWRKSRNESFCFCVFPVLRGACLYCLCAYHSLCYTWTLWSHIVLSALSWGSEEDIEEWGAVLRSCIPTALSSNSHMWKWADTHPQFFLFLIIDNAFQIL